MKQVLFFLFVILCFKAKAQTTTSESSNNNPIFKGWYADPEGIVFDKTYWVYPTFSAPYEKQVFMDAFSSKDLKHWTKHSKIIDTSAVKWAKKAIWAPS
ncbi:MAG: arabinan endo-1,5-alpha-L-arabinosidase, partial [Chryseobacterium sp.]